MTAEKTEGVALPVAAGVLEWVASSGGSSPENAIQGGTACDGAALFIARGTVSDDGEVSPGKLHDGQEAARIPHDGAEHCAEDYEVLTNGGGVALTWVPMTCTSGGVEAVPTGAVQGGSLEDGHPIFLARATHEESGDVIPGKLVPRFERCYFPWGGQEIWVTECEVLCVTSVQPTVAEC